MRGAAIVGEAPSCDDDPPTAIRTFNRHANLAAHAVVARPDVGHGAVLDLPQDLPL